MKAWQLVLVHGRRLIGRTVVSEVGETMVIKRVNTVNVASIVVRLGARLTGWVAVTDWPIETSYTPGKK